jgi:putative membrane protein
VSYDDLPALNAGLNATVAVLLVAGRECIRRKAVAAHRACMVAGLLLSAAFLCSYVVYHAGKEGVVTPFPGTGGPKVLYYVVLFTHVPLAAATLPLVGISLRHALKGDFARHRRWVRWTWPIWLYVSVTGVAVYVMLYRVDWA